MTKFNTIALVCFVVVCIVSSSYAQDSPPAETVSSDTSVDVSIGTYDYLSNAYNAELFGNDDEDEEKDESVAVTDVVDYNDNLIGAESEEDANVHVAEIDEDVDIDDDAEEDVVSTGGLRSLKGKKKAKYAAPSKKVIVPVPVQMPMQGKKGGYGYDMNNYGTYSGGYGSYYRRALKEYAPSVKGVPTAKGTVTAPPVPSKAVTAPTSSYVPVRQNYVEVPSAVPVYASKAFSAPSYSSVATVSSVPGYNKIESSHHGVSDATLRYLHGKKKAKKSYGKEPTVVVAPMKMAMTMPVAQGKGGYGYGGGHGGHYGGGYSNGYY